jgi:hypothetical protein
LTRFLSSSASVRATRIAIALTVFAAAPTPAHEAHGKAQHGGVVAEAGSFQGELVTRPKGLVLHLSDHGKPVSTAGASGKLVVLVAGVKSELVLAPAGENRLAPPKPEALPRGTRAVATVTLADGRSGALRFEVK